jgi:peroxiredoxin
MRKFLAVCLLVATGQLSAQNRVFTINGNISGAKEGTKLYLEETSPVRRRIDSAIITNGVFFFKGSLRDEAKQLYIFSADMEKGMDYTSLWIGPGTITLTGKNGKLRGAAIAGSEIQKTVEALRDLAAPLRKMEDSLSALADKEKDTTVRRSLLKQARVASNRQKEMEKEFVRDNPASFYSAYLLSLYSTTWGKEKVAELYSGFSNNLKNTLYGKDIETFISLSRELKPGDSYADFTQKNTSGKDISLSSVIARNKYVLLDFWSSYCGPCREENPRLQKTYEAFKSKGFEILGVSMDDNKTLWLDAVKKDGITWVNVSDLQGDKNKAALMYNISSMPNSFLIDGTGKIVGRNLRGKELYDTLAGLMK